MELAQQNPDINYIGIERYSSVLLRGLQKRAQLELNNIYFSRPYLLKLLRSMAKRPPCKAPSDFPGFYGRI